MLVTTGNILTLPVLSRHRVDSMVSAPTEGSSRQKLHGHILSIEQESGVPGLLKAIQAIVARLNDKNEMDKKKASRRSIQRYIGSSPSSQPTGFSWTVGAIIQNLESLLGITSTNTKAIKEVLSLPLSDQITLLGGLVERVLSKRTPVNDRGNTFEAVMSILGELGPEYGDLVLVTVQPLIGIFYDDIRKPFVNYVGNNFRSADGSGNSTAIKDVGMAGSFYSRTVTSTSPNNEQLPPPAEVFERLLKRPDDEFTPHQGGINMLLFYLAIVITHDLFYTDPKDPRRNLTTSYLDLSSLYGYNRQDQLSMRQMKGGLLKPDQWFDKRLVIQPAGVGALLVLFSRNHNYIAENLLQINENERFSYGPGRRLVTAEDQDEELFQTARLVNTGCVANIIIHDYVRTILGTQSDSDFVFDPFSVPSYPVYGNAVSIEFNVIYRWHGAIGQEDAKWLTSVMSLLGRDFGRTPQPQSRLQSPNGLTDQGIFDQILNAFNDAFVHASPQELALGLPLAGAHRDLKTGTFSDFDLAKVIRAGYAQVASDLGNGFKTPAALKPVEVAGIQQARNLNTCYFNDFRRHLNLTPLATFEDFSENVDIQQGLKDLYGTPDKVELYAGLMVERTKVIGLHLPYTMGRAILSDAVNLLRNDRILTQEMTPGNLTNWGYLYQKGDPKQHNRVLPQMFNTLLPNANANQDPVFSQAELDTLFTAPKK